jgi:hypothetical protein
MSKWLWLDDVRPPPTDEWDWVRNYDEAIAYAEAHPAPATASLDHDLYFEHYPRSGVPAGQWIEKCGYDVVRALMQRAWRPARIILHTMNEDGQRNMLFELARNGYRLRGYARVSGAHPRSPVLHLT